MMRVALRNLAATKLRFALTALSIVLGVAFVTGSFVLADSLRASVDKIFDDAAGANDLVVRSVEGPTGDRPIFALDTVAEVQAVDGVSDAAPRLEGAGALLVDGDATGIGISNWVDNEALSSFSLSEGRGPTDADEVVLTKTLAGDEGLEVGDAVALRGDGPVRDYEVVGLSTFSSDADDLLPYAFMTLPEAQSTLDVDGVYEIGVALEAGVDPDAATEALSAELPAGLEVVDGQAAIAADREQVQDTVNVLGNALLAFAVVAVLVGSFIVFNTFSITFAQRRRQLALLRAVGARAGQIRRMLIGEAMLVGLVASVVGVVAGLGLAVGLEELIGLFGDEIPTSETVLSMRTIIVAVVVGMGVTLAAATLPARRVSKVAPVAALRDDAGSPRRSGWRGTVVGLVLAALGAGALYAAGPVPGARTSLILIGAGSLAIVGAAAFLAPTLVPVASRVLGAPLRFLGVPGQLGRDNTAREPRRTAATAAALMIGLAVVSVAAVFAASAKETLTNQVDSRLLGDVIISPDEDGFEGLPAGVDQRIAANPDVTAVGVASFSQWSDGEKTRDLVSIDPVAFAEVYDAPVADGAVTDLAPGGVLLDEGLADDLGLEVGDTLPMTTPGGQLQARVDALIDDQILGNAVIHTADLPRLDPDAVPVFMVAAGPEGTDPAVLAETLEADVGDFPGVLVQDRDEFVADLRAEVDQVLNLIYALLALTGLIAVIGIINTLSLSVLERTREIGLLRAVGLTGRQAKRMIRAESVLISLIGALLGLALGTVLGVVISNETPIIEVVQIPWAQLGLFAAIAALAGVLAAVWPARRAAKLDVLRAVTAD